MKILVIGGTQFIGRHFALAALARGHDVTLFHQGSKGTGSIPGAEDVLGDRNTDLSLVSGRTFDAVMDSSAYLPGVVRTSTMELKDSCGLYQFVSTVSVYDSDGEPAGDENSPLVAIGDPEEKNVTGDSYGYLKVLCEQIVEDAFEDRNMIVRPGVVAGSYDPTNRFTYWVMRFHDGGEVLVPNVPSSRLQLIDARDLAEFMVKGLEDRLLGIYNAAGQPSTFGQMIETCRSISPGAEPRYVDIEKLREREVALWSDVPLALPPGKDALFAVSSAKAVAHGLTYRTLADTARDVIQWKSSSRDEAPPRMGMSREKELTVLQGLNA